MTMKETRPEAQSHQNSSISNAAGVSNWTVNNQTVARQSVGEPLPLQGALPFPNVWSHKSASRSARRIEPPVHTSLLPRVSRDKNGAFPAARSRFLLSLLQTSTRSDDVRSSVRGPEGCIERHAGAWSRRFIGLCNIASFSASGQTPVV